MICPSFQTIFVTRKINAPSALNTRSIENYLNVICLYACADVLQLNVG